LDSIKITAEYLGYTGIKSLSFPVDPMLPLERYPNVTNQLTQWCHEVLKELKPSSNSPFWKNQPRYIRFLLKNSATAAALDTKFHPNYPGRNQAGQVQYARYKGRVVSANYLSNNLFGQIMSALGYPFWFTTLIGKIYSTGMLEIFRGHLPTLANLKFRDPAEDGRAVKSGYDDYLKGNPWLHTLDPKEPYPNVVQQRLWQARHSESSSTPLVLRMKAAIL
jgi:hypothetical protein